MASLLCRSCSKARLISPYSSRAQAPWMQPRPMRRSVAAAATGGIQQMTVQELQQLLVDEARSEGVQFVDVREPGEHVMAKLPRFKLFPLSQAPIWSDTITDDLDIAKPTVVLCHHGVRSMQMSAFLVSKGFVDVANVVGGIHAYSMGVDPNVPTY
ncbi:MAG: Rhodanese-like domain-containing protein [Monoraphidium minutum]|nr:MAG: Rhodanese-like domain-containing protein [Monoraphidium minutum]